MKKPRIAIVSFPGNNGDTENLRTFKRCGFDPFVFRWNDSHEKLHGVEGYFIGAGFAYEDRGRAGMVAGRDPLFTHLHQEASKGIPVIGCCNGAQVLIESGLIPLGDGMRMSLARNAYEQNGKTIAPGFLNEWVWITPICKRGRCATAGWEGSMHIPIAHGEGRFITKDKDLIEELKRNDQLTFAYCNPTGEVATEPPYCPNGSMMGVAGICNPEGNVVALMPHPERTANGDPYFRSLAAWISAHPSHAEHPITQMENSVATLRTRESQECEFFIQTKIVNNEERTVEQAAKKLAENLTLKQLKYISVPLSRSQAVLGSLSLFNPNKETAYVRKNGVFYKWDADAKTEIEVDCVLDGDIALLRTDEPDAGASALGAGSTTGVCYVCSGVDKENILRRNILDIFGNPHSSTLEIL